MKSSEPIRASSKRSAQEAPARWRDVELPQGWIVDRAEGRQGAHAEEAEGLGVHEEAGQQPQGPEASSQEGQQSRAGGLQKKLSMRVARLKESHPTAKVEL